MCCCEFPSLLGVFCHAPVGSQPFKDVPPQRLHGGGGRITGGASGAANPTLCLARAL